MKKARILVIPCLLALLLSACSSELDNLDEYRTAYETAVANSMNADIYYWQETRTEGTESFNREANVYALRDDDGNFLYNADGSYQGHCIFAADRTAGIEYYAGLSQSSAGGAAENYLLERHTDEDGTVTATRQPMTAQEFYDSETFHSYRVDSLLAELTELSFDDMDFTTEDADAESKLHLKTIAFAVKPEYLQSYYEAHGEQSMFAGSKYVTIEMAYDRVTQVVIYAEEKEDDNFSVDQEVYNLRIAYYGPIIQMPSHDQTTDGELVWKDK